MLEPYVSPVAWRVNRPHILVVACSDGRLQGAVDSFLNTRLAIQHYDRLYLPGGPGALASSGVEHLRSESQRKEFLFLLEAHEIETVVLLFHGPTGDGPDLAVCADYARALGTMDRHVIAEMQQRDFSEIQSDLSRPLSGLAVHGFRCEVGANLSPRFVELG